jgi:hypothetical protein
MTGYTIMHTRKINSNNPVAGIIKVLSPSQERLRYCIFRTLSIDWPATVSMHSFMLSDKGLNFTTFIL